MRERRLVSYLLGIVHDPGHLIHERLAAKIDFRNFLAGDGIHCVEFLQIFRNCVKAHPLFVVVAMGAAVYSREEHVEFRIHFHLALIVPLNVVVAAPPRESAVFLQITSSEETILRLSLSTPHSFCVKRLAGFNHLRIVRDADHYRTAILSVLYRIVGNCLKLLLHAGVQSLAVKQRILSILLAVEV